MWDSPGDALASAAAYLARSGWRRGAPWLLEARLPEDFDFAHADPGRRLPVEAWQMLRIAPAGSRGFPQTDDLFALLLPAGAQGPALLAGTNHRVIRRYNASTSYQLAVGLLADAIAKRPGLAAAWPAEDKGLGREERIELQERLNALGHDPGGIDAVLGSQTRRAIRAFQRTKGLPADGYPSPALLQVLRAE